MKDLISDGELCLVLADGVSADGLAVHARGRTSRRELLLEPLLPCASLHELVH